jgi:deoxyribodipyrimidine photo-lyase
MRGEILCWQMFDASMTFMIHGERIKGLSDNPVTKGNYVLYWMQSSQRAEVNHALEYALVQANALNLPLLVGFGLMDDYPDANVRHYTFMLQGLQEAQKTLEKRGIKMVVQRGNPADVAVSLSKDAALVVTDRGYLRPAKQWREKVAKEIRCRFVQIETDVVVPVEVVSNKAEFGARTIRPKIMRQLETFLQPVEKAKVKKKSLALEVKSLDLSDIAKVVSSLNLDKSVPPVDTPYSGGQLAGRKVFLDFLEHRFSSYVTNRNQPQTSDTSYMSRYLHFGNISPLELVFMLREKGEGQANIASYLEEVVVRRDLAINFCNFTPNYDSYECIPAWAKKTLDEHRHDKRVRLYSLEELEKAQTHDAYWNAAQKEMLYTGYMHNYMRMYWGKKILEWSATPEEAFTNTLYLNNKYFIDGRNANGFVGVAWVFGVHDRPWKERPIFGKVRYMNAAGLERKADPKAYVKKVEKLVAAQEKGSPRLKL